MNNEPILVSTLYPKKTFDNNLLITQEYCWDKMGGYLTNIQNQNEQDFLANLLEMTETASKH